MYGDCEPRMPLLHRLTRVRSWLCARRVCFGTLTSLLVISSCFGDVEYRVENCRCGRGEYDSGTHLLIGLSLIAVAVEPSHNE